MIYNNLINKYIVHDVLNELSIGGQKQNIDSQSTNQNNDTEEDEDQANDTSQTDDDTTDPPQEEEPTYDMDDTSADENNDDNSVDTQQDDGTPESTQDKLNKMEDNIYDNLSDDQKLIKIENLKKRFQEMYNKCGELIENVSQLPKTSETAKIYDKLLCMLNDIKNYISFYISRTFDSYSYIENSTIFQKYLFIINGICNVLDEISQGNTDENKNIPSKT